MAPSDALSLRSTIQGLSDSTVIAISTGVGGTILTIIITLLILLFRQISKHKLLLADLEQRGIDLCRPNVREASKDQTKRFSALRRSTFALPSTASAGWINLDSNEDISGLPNRPARTQRIKYQQQSTDPRKIGSRFSNRRESELNHPLKEVRACAPTLDVKNTISKPANSTGESMLSSDNPKSPKESSENMHVQRLNDDSVNRNVYYSAPFALASEANSMESLTPRPLFSSGKIDETSIPLSKKRVRAKTIATTVRHVYPDSPLSSSFIGPSRMHIRSVSLGAVDFPSRPPKEPAPPLPLEVAAQSLEDRRRSWIQDSNSSRLSASSLESVGTSVLASPKIPRSYNIKLKDGPSHQWKNSLIAGPRPLLPKPKMSMATTSPDKVSKSESIKSRTAEYNSNSEEQRSLSRAASIKSVDNHLSVPIIDTAERCRLSRVSGPSSRQSQPIRTPRRVSKHSVTANGSPVERIRTSVLHEVPGSQNIPSRRTSQVSSGPSSTRSSNGNPFQWDPSPMQSGKPSALKGSPNSRKGHRRQNCVRISLSPTIINSHKASPSPSMGNIAEESTVQSKEDGGPRSGIEFSGIRALPRPPSSPTFAPDIKLKPTFLRASLTPSSPTLSLNCFQMDHDNNDSIVSLVSLTSDLNRVESNSSIFTIPTFPSPGRPVTAINRCTIPTPTFSFSRPSGEFDEEDCTPIEFRLLAEPVAVSSSKSIPELSEVKLMASPPTLDQRSPDVLPEPGQLEASPTPSATETKHQASVNSTDALPSAFPWINTLTRHDTPPSRAPSSPAISPKSQPAPQPAQRPATASTRAPALPARAKRASPPSPSPLRRSIAALRRMNSDAERAGRSRAAARRYLRLGREASAGALRGVDALLAGSDGEPGREDGAAFWGGAGEGVMGEVRDGGNARDWGRVAGGEGGGKGGGGSPGSLYDENGFYRGS